MLGAGSQGSTNLQDYITNAPDEQIYFYVVRSKQMSLSFFDI